MNFWNFWKLNNERRELQYRNDEFPRAKKEFYRSDQIFLTILKLGLSFWDSHDSDFKRLLIEGVVSGTGIPPESRTAFIFSPTSGTGIKKNFQKLRKFFFPKKWEKFFFEIFEFNWDSWSFTGFSGTGPGLGFKTLRFEFGNQKLAGIPVRSRCRPLTPIY